MSHSGWNNGSAWKKSLSETPDHFYRQNPPSTTIEYSTGGSNGKSTEYEANYCCRSPPYMQSCWQPVWRWHLSGYWWRRMPSPESCQYAMMYWCWLCMRRWWRRYPFHQLRKRSTASRHLLLRRPSKGWCRFRCWIRWKSCCQRSLLPSGSEEK